MRTATKIKPQNKVEEIICDECIGFLELLITKNRAYGNSAIKPKRIFSQASPKEQIYVRMDDKISRMVSGIEKGKVPEDTFKDFIGYAILLRVLERLENEK